MTTLDHTSSQTRPPATPRDLRPLWRVLLALVIPLGPLGIAATRAVMPYWTDDDVETATGLMLSEPGRAAAMEWIFFVAYPLLLLSVLGVAHAARRGAPRLATAGGLIAFLSCAFVGAVGSTDAVTTALDGAGYEPGAIVAVAEATTAAPMTSVATLLFVIGHILGFILLGVAVARSGIVAPWVGWMIAVSQPIHLVSAIIVPSRLLDVVAGWGFTTIGFAIVALAVLRLPVEDLDLPPRPR